MRSFFFALVVLLTCPPGAMCSDDMTEAAERLADAAAGRRQHRFAIEAFQAGEPGDAEAAAQAQAQFSEALFRVYGVGVADASVLRRLKERGRYWAQVKVGGEVFGTGSGRVLVLEARDAAGGERVAVIQVELGRNGAAKPPDDFRDAPAGDWCSLEASALKRENSELVDVKARHWALQARMPGFSWRKLERPPSGERGDYATLQKFFVLANEYYEQAGPLSISGEEIARLKLLQGREEDFAARCPGRW